MSRTSVLGMLLGPLTGTAIALAAVAPPMHAAADASVAAHMIQHLVLILVAAPLLCLGRPGILATRIIPVGVWRAVARVVRGSRIRARHAAVVGISACLVHFAVVWAWHSPWLYAQAIASRTVHALEHVSLVVTACAFWSAVSSRRAFGPAGAVVVLFVAAGQGTVLGALLTLAETPWYVGQAGAGRPGSLTALEDQQLAGLFMWIAGGLAYAGVALVGMSRAISRSVLGAGMVLTASLGAAACRTESQGPATVVLGDGELGRRAIERYGCGGCHSIPGVRGARGTVGPSLARLAERPFLAGSFVNEPANLVDWVRNPRRLDPTTIMPNLGVTDADARNIAAFLYRAQ